jgi:hypothetical protein
MTVEQITQSANLVDGELASKFYKQRESELNEGSDKNFIEDNKADIQKAIKETYGSTATIDENGKVTY